MIKNLFDVGDYVVFSQRYLPSEHQSAMYGKQGIVVDKDGDYCEVQFDHEDETTTILCTDLELYSEFVEKPTESVGDDEDTTEDEFRGMSRTQLIAQKLFAQEHDPVLDATLTQLINSETK